MDAKIHQLTEIILSGFSHHFTIFTLYNKKAADFFKEENYSDAKKCAKDQIDLYDQRIQECLTTIKPHLPKEFDPQFWRDMRANYNNQLSKHLQPDLAESFYNSLFCKLYDRQYYTNEFLFFTSTVNTGLIQSKYLDYRSYYFNPKKNEIFSVVESLLNEIPIDLPFEDFNRDRDNIATSILEYQQTFPGISTYCQINILSPVFYRNRAAYIIGHIINNNNTYPFVIALYNHNQSLYTDAFVTSPRDLSNLFSFARAYFKVDHPIPSAVINFLRKVIPTKSIADWYTIIGFHKQGKNEFYRFFTYHLQHSNDQFIVTDGIAGLVMFVFTLSSFPYVFKVIKDPPFIMKNITAREIKKRYHYVKQNDRVGRMADMWEFSHVAFPADRFSEKCLKQLQQMCGGSVSIEGDKLFIKHLYIERRLIPLNIFLDNIEEMGREHSAEIIVDYGQSIKDMITAGTFPGDFLTKNFGITPRGRVVFYDYDEVIPLEKCNFRAIPKPQNEQQRYASKPWYIVRDNDVFPEEFEQFLVRDQELKSIFKEIHGDLFTLDYWQTIQNNVKNGDIPNIYPYRNEIRYNVQTT